eukprot:COSAG06_NODE_2445_length_6866_cov_9.468450_2_plen_212_part_00
MGCGASNAAGPPAAAAGAPATSAAPAASSAAPAADAASAESSSGLFEPEPELVLTEAERHDEIAAGESTVVGGVTPSSAPAAERVSETSQLDGVADEAADIDGLATVGDAPADAPAPAPAAKVETGGTWSAQSKFSEKMDFSAPQVDALARAFAEKVRKTRLFLSHLHIKRSFYQDRLGTNIHVGKALKNRPFSCRMPTARAGSTLTSSRR